MRLKARAKEVWRKLGNIRQSLRGKIHKVSSIRPFGHDWLNESNAPDSDVDDAMSRSIPHRYPGTKTMCGLRTPLRRM